MRRVVWPGDRQIIVTAGRLRRRPRGELYQRGRARPHQCRGFSKRALASEQGAFLEMSVLSEALMEGNPPIPLL